MPDPRHPILDPQSLILNTNSLAPDIRPRALPRAGKGMPLALGVMVTLAATAAANLVATLEVGACGALLVELTQLSRLICR